MKLKIKKLKNWTSDDYMRFYSFLLIFFTATAVGLIVLALTIHAKGA